MVELKVLGVSPQADGNSPLLLLHPRGTELILCLHIGPVEAFAISSALYNLAAEPETGELASVAGQTRAVQRDAGQPALLPRPMTHDLMLDCLTVLGGRLVCVELLRVVNGVFYAEAVVAHGGERVRLDCRPSDGIALAVRCSAPVLAAQQVLEHASELSAVFAALPEHARALAQTALLALKVADSRNRQAATSSFFAASLPEPHVGSSREFEPPEADGRKKTPTIRVAVVRQGKKDGQAEVLQSFDLTPQDFLQTMRAEAARQADASEAGPPATEEDRWTALLQALTPETKTQM